MSHASRHNRLVVFLTGALSWHWYANIGTPIENHLGADEILTQYGDINTLALENIIDPSDGTDEEMTLMIQSQYYTIDSLPVKMSQSNYFNVISLNAQSIIAKFDTHVSGSYSTTKYYHSCHMFTKILARWKIWFIIISNWRLHLHLPRQAMQFPRGINNLCGFPI